MGAMGGCLDALAGTILSTIWKRFDFSNLLITRTYKTNLDTGKSKQQRSVVNADDTPLVMIAPSSFCSTRRHSSVYWPTTTELYTNSGSWFMVEIPFACDQVVVQHDLMI
jgi:hypothetical protein